MKSIIVNIPSSALTLLVALLCFCKPNKNTESPHWLINLKSTGRISSNQYSDFELDEEGNAYLSCFFKGEEGKDRIYITKVNANGQKAWESYPGNKGRATAITRDPKGRFWVTGFFSGVLRFGEKTIEGGGSVRPFLACLNREGECLHLIAGSGSCIGFNLTINTKGQILMAGIGGKEFNWGAISHFSQKSGDSPFLALFDERGQCRWIQSFTAPVNRLATDHSGNFFLTGSFYQAFDYHEISDSTTSLYDSDGYLMKLDTLGKVQWFKSFGYEGEIKYGYRTHDGGNDLIALPDGGVLLASCEDYPLQNSSQARLILQEYDLSGKLKRKKEIVRNTHPGLAFCMAQYSDGRITLSASAKDSVLILGENYFLSGENQSLLITLSPDWEEATPLLPKHGPNTLFRMARALGNKLYVSGHFQQFLELDGKRIENNGAHGLFLGRK